MIRLANQGDAPRIHGIYAPIVDQTAISFEWEPPGESEMAARIAGNERSGLPWLVLERNGHLHGYACAARHRERAAYRWSVDVSVYVDPEHRREGVARRLYGSLFSVLSLQGYCGAYAGATLPNPASVRLHEGLGFEEVGVYRKVGYKHGAWHDVIWWSKELRPKEGAPPELRSIAEAQQDPAWLSALNPDAGRGP